MAFRLTSILMVLAWISVRALAAGPDFQRQIRPILSDKCFACHGPDESRRKAGLRLDLPGEPFKVLKSGHHAIVPGRPAESELVRRLDATDDDEVMPPPKFDRHLSSTEKELLRQWIAAGAEFSDHWAFQPPIEPGLPETRTRGWARNPVDRFVLKKLEERDLVPEPEAERTTLARRAALDLTGLPPTPEEVDQFLADRSPGSYERLVDRLLESPAYGERMAQWWLDLARYADTNGYHIDTHRDLWLWREWVIRAFNRNVPFDRFTVEQLAGDLLPGATPEQKVASGFNRNTMVNFEGGADPDEYQTKYVVDRVNTTGLTWLGLTVGCAECHDHKYDPISTREFYQLFAFFNSITERGLDGSNANPVPVMKVPSADQQESMERHRVEMKRLEAELAARLEMPTDAEAAAFTTWLDGLRGGLSDSWTPMTAVQAKSAGGSTLTSQADGSIVVSGANPDTDRYEIIATLGDRTFSGLRIEALPDASLTQGAFARSDNGNFVMTGVEATVEPLNAGHELDPKQVTAGNWWSIGPFTARDAKDAFDRDFLEVSSIAPGKGAAEQGGKTWGEHPDWKDGVQIDLTGDNAATYVSRVLTSPKAGWIRVGVGSDDGIRIWLNGRERLSHNVARAAAARQDYAFLPLKAGENRLVMKISNGGGGYAFFFERMPEPVTSLPVSFAAAFADFAQSGFPASNLIDTDPKSGWAGEGQNPAHRKPHQAILVAGDVGGFESGSRLRVTLRFESGFAKHQLGRFRVATSSRRELAAVAELPDAVRSALFAGAGEASGDAQKRLKRHFLEQRSEAVRDLGKRLNGSKDALAKLESQVPETMIMAEMEKPRDTFQLMRGNWQSKGDKVLPGTPAFLPPLRKANPNRASRLDLAQWLVDPANPLPARVTVNRLWQMVFGTGLVKTANDFGNQGDLPSHPELLDWLGYEFSHGLATPGGGRGAPWDVKAVMRLLVTSASYRQSSAVTAAKLEADPYNRLISRGPRFRLDAEFVRDQALAVSGLLDRRLGGSSVRPYQPPGLWEAIGFGNGFSSQSYTQDHGADLYRRGIYVYWKRSLPHPSMTTFDAPNREVCTVSRPRTSTPLQALVLMNDPQYVEAARALAQRVLKEGKGDLQARLGYAFRLVVGRSPTKAEQTLLSRVYQQQLTRFTADRQAAEKLISVGEGQRPQGIEPGVLAAWTALGNLLLNLDEVITKG